MHNGQAALVTNEMVPVMSEMAPETSRMVLVMNGRVQRALGMVAESDIEGGKPWCSE